MPETELEFLNDANALLSQTIEQPGDPWEAVKHLANEVRERITDVEASEITVRSRYMLGANEAAIKRALETPHPDMAGLAGRPIADILKEVNAVLRACNIEEEESYFSTGTFLPGESHTWPNTWRWISCFPVMGSNEGYYVHIEIITQMNRPAPGDRRLVATAKCWRWETAQAMAAVAATLFEGPDSWKLKA